MMGISPTGRTLRNWVCFAQSAPDASRAAPDWLRLYGCAVRRVSRDTLPRLRGNDPGVCQLGLFDTNGSLHPTARANWLRLARCPAFVVTPQGVVLNAPWSALQADDENWLRLFTMLSLIGALVTPVPAGT
jgi:hypothetical protein